MDSIIYCYGFLCHSRTFSLFNILSIQQKTYFGNPSKSDPIPGAGKVNIKERHGWRPRGSYSLTGKRHWTRNYNHIWWMSCKVTTQCFWNMQQGGFRLFCFLREVEGSKLFKTQVNLQKVSLLTRTFIYVYMYIYLQTSWALILNAAGPSRYIFPHLSMKKFKRKVIKITCLTHIWLQKQAYLKNFLVVDVKDMRMVILTRAH